MVRVIISRSEYVQKTVDSFKLEIMVSFVFW